MIRLDFTGSVTIEDCDVQQLKCEIAAVLGRRALDREMNVSFIESPVASSSEGVRA